jgi:hypothetical protein
LSQLPVKDGQLFIELAPGFCEFIESCLSLGVGGTVTWCRLWVGTAQGRSHADVAFACRVAGRMVGVLRVVTEPEVAPVVRKLLT